MCILSIVNGLSELLLAFQTKMTYFMSSGFLSSEASLEIFYRQRFFLRPMYAFFTLKNFYVFFTKKTYQLADGSWVKNCFHSLPSLIIMLFTGLLSYKTRSICRSHTAEFLLRASTSGSTI